ncbi:uncharacterized protein DUF1850 [Halanaerobium saccharolyticum]|uniref:Uncharacterized protein DUF1850 n=1 Tax=Halanaerobium saccharolyticum TaxID=43595 RepID=A0A4R6LKF6_9FIRM|nr:DUF1850 domain-containing protein [Halanaerobium saccharolyticum]TDO85273.1 uncharacterized protein DUF1850 [Halanaerobium saccharolyticum]
MNKNKVFKFFLFGLLLFIIVFSLFVFKVNTLQLIDYKADKIIWEEKVKAGDNFVIKYQHSVARTPVLEFFEIKDGKILLTGTEYQSYGAGLPTSAEQGDYIVENDRFYIKNIDQFLPEIMLRVSDYAEHEFIFNQESFKLYKNLKTGTLLQIKTEKISYFTFILRRF